MQQIIDPQFTNILADMMLKLVVKLRGVDKRFHDEGPKRSADFVRSCINQQQDDVIRSCGAAMAVVNAYESRATGKHPMPRVSLGFPSISALRVARSGLQEVIAGRHVPLFRHDAEELGESPFDDKRVLIKAAAAAFVQFCIHTKTASKNDAATWVTNTLNTYGFKNPTGANYSAETIKYWHKKRRKYEYGFNDYYRQWIKYFYLVAKQIELRRRQGEMITDLEQSSLFLEQLSGIVSMFAYRQTDATELLGMEQD